MPYIITKKNGKKVYNTNNAGLANTVFTRDDVSNLARDPNNCYVLVSPVTRRSIRIGGACRGKTTPANLWGARRKRQRR